MCISHVCTQKVDTFSILEIVEERGKEGGGILFSFKAYSRVYLTWSVGRSLLSTGRVGSGPAQPRHVGRGGQITLTEERENRVWVWVCCGVPTIPSWGPPTVTSKVASKDSCWVPPRKLVEKELKKKKKNNNKQKTRRIRQYIFITKQNNNKNIYRRRKKERKKVSEWAS